MSRLSLLACVAVLAVSTAALVLTAAHALHLHGWALAVTAFNFGWSGERLMGPR